MIGASRKPPIEPRLRAGSCKESPTETPPPPMQPEGSRREIGVS
jgi:hypothetical protein